MPVTAKLSRLFYERFGDEIVDELVELLNQVDLTYRSELREQNEMNFARFDAKLEQRIAELRAEVRTELHGIRSELHDEIHGLRSELHDEIHGLRGEVHALKAELIKWMFLFWAGTALAGLLLRG